MSKPGKGRRGAGLAALLAAVVAVFGAFAATASATNYQRPLEGVFGSAAQPTFDAPSALSVDLTSGDVLVGEITDVTFPGTGVVKRFNPDGTPAPFAALGGNVIDGKAGPEGKPCAEEPASCDKTPQNQLEMNSGGRQQIAVDPTNGNVYVTQYWSNLVYIFSSGGAYLGQLSGAGLTGFNRVCGVVVDSTGAVYVAQNRKINKYVPTGAIPVNADNTANFDMGHEGACRMALGSGPSAGSIFITTTGTGALNARTLKVDTETGEVGEFVKALSSLVTVDPTTGNPIIATGDSSSEAVEFDGSGEAAGAELSRLVVVGGLRDLVATSSGEVYVITTGEPHVSLYGAPAVVPTVTIDPATDVTSSEATLSGAVNPEGIEITECFFEYALPNPNGSFSAWKPPVPCEESIPTDSGAHTVHATISGLIPNGQEYGFRLVARNQNGAERSTTETLITARTTATEPATVTGLQSATLNGLLRPEGLQYTECHFEWGLTTNAEYEHTAPCDPPAWEIPADSAPHSVTAPLGELQEATTYRYRLVATTSAGTIPGEELTFETFGPPQIDALRARNADQDSVTIEAEIDPRGFDTSYRFEWGSTASYGKVVPASFEPVGSGTDPVRVSAEISGLPAGSSYHYRVVASGPGGTTESDDQVLETLNSCGLPEGRCVELVSRADPGPVAIPGDPGPPIDIYAQAATDGPGGLAYPVESGYPDATRGFSVLYRGARGESGWSSIQLSTPILDQNQKGGVSSTSGATLWLPDDLSCGFGQSSQPLTDDPGPRLLYERGGMNLYRLDPDGSYTAVTKLAPENLGPGSYDVAGASQDCGKVLFSSGYRYPGIAAAGAQPLYEWDQGVLRNAGIIPGPSGEVVVAASPGGFNAVSEDGSRVFFTAMRQTSPNPDEVGKNAIFVREDGATTRDLSLSATATPSGDATYQWATPDGSRVLFTADAGLTEDSSPTGTDLYEYDLETEELTDLSVNDRPGGAQVGGFVGGSEDGSHVYFIARGQFFPGQGSTLAQNQSDNTYSLYGVSEGQVSFVATVSGDASELRYLADPGWRDWVSSVSPDGRYLLFQSTANVIGYDSGGATEAYLYDAADGWKGVVCVSCRPDGQPSVAGSYYSVLAAGEAINNPLHPPQFLTVRGGEPQVFFSSLNVLAPGAVEGQNNVYEWSHGQVFRLISAQEGQANKPFASIFAGFLGASEDGSDVYLSGPEALNWEDPDERQSVYTARIGGGFPEPPPGPTPCDPDVEGSCQGAAPGAAAAAPGAASATFSGPGNVKQAQKKKQKKRKSARKRGAKKKNAKKGKHGKQKRKRAGANRRAGK